MLVVITSSHAASDALLLAFRGSTGRHPRFSEENSEECLFQECNSEKQVTKKPVRSRTGEQKTESESKKRQKWNELITQKM